MSLTDRDLEDLFRGAENSYRPKYKSKYFRDIEVQLPVYKKSYIKHLFLLALLLLIPIQSVRYLIGESTMGTIETLSKNNTISNHSKIKKTPFISKNTSIFTAYRKPNLNKTELIEPSNDKVNFYEKQNTSSTFNISKLQPKAINLSISKKDIVANNTTLKKIRPSTHNFSVSVNGGMEQSWTTGENHSVNGTIAIQAEYEKPIKNFSLNFGLGMQLTQFDNLKIEERTKIYNFSSSELEQSYKFGSMLSMLVPVSVSYQKSKHRFEAGLNARVNLMTTVFYKETLDNETSKTSEGYTGVDLFNRFGLQPYLGYSYNINNKTAIGVNAGISLIKPTNSSRFKGETRNNPIAINFYLQRNLSWNR
jgi:hypothetical protein